MREKNTREVLNHHLTAFGNNDLDGIIEDYTEQSELLTIDGKLKGLVDIKEAFCNLFKQIPTGSHFEIKQLTISENVAHIIWSGKSEVAEFSFASDTFVFESDKIRFHTISLGMDKL